MLLGGGFEAFSGFSEGIEQDFGSIGNFSPINLLDTVEFGEIFGDTNCELFFVIVFRELGFEMFFEQSGEVIIHRYEAGRRFDCIDIAIDAKLRPENPDELVSHCIQIFPVFASEEIIDGEDEGRFLDAFGKVEIDLDIFAERYRNEVEIRHKVECSDTLLADSSRGGFRFEGSTFQDNTLVPVKGLFNRIPGVTVAASVNHTANGDAIWVVERGVAIVEVRDAEGITGVFVSGRNGIALVIGFTVEPCAGEIGAFGRYFTTHTEPVGFFMSIKEDIGEDDLHWVCEDLVNDGVVFCADVLDDAEDALFNVDSTDLAAFFAEIGDIISDDCLARQHRG